MLIHGISIIIYNIDALPKVIHRTEILLVIQLRFNGSFNHDVSITQ